MTAGSMSRGGAVDEADAGLGDQSLDVGFDFGRIQADVQVDERQRPSEGGDGVGDVVLCPAQVAPDPVLGAGVDRREVLASDVMPRSSHPVGVVCAPPRRTLRA